MTGQKSPHPDCPCKAAAREGGMFEGPVGDDWYQCICEEPKMTFNNKLSLLMGFAAGGVVGVLIGLLTSDPKVDVNPEPTYELVQIINNQVYVVDYNQSYDDCITQIKDNPKANLGCAKE